MRFPTILGLAVAVCFIGGFVAAGVSTSLAEAIFVSCAIVSALAAVAYVVASRNIFAPAVLAAACVIAAYIGDYLPYRLGIWGLSDSDYGSLDMPGANWLIVSGTIFTVLALFVGFIVGLLTLVIVTFAKNASNRRTRRSH